MYETAMAVHNFRYAILLARGTTSFAAPQPATISAEVRLAAELYADSCLDYFVETRRRSQLVKGPWHVSRMAVDLLISEVTSSARSFQFWLNETKKPTVGGLAEPLANGNMQRWANAAAAAYEPLAVTNGEIDYARTNWAITDAAFNVGAELLVAFSPLGGPLLLLEAEAGLEIFTGRTLSKTERCFNVFAVLVLPILIDKAIKAGAITWRMLKAANLMVKAENAKLFDVMRYSWRLAVGLRSFPEAEFAKCMTLIEMVRRDVVMTEKQLARLNFYLNRMEDAAVTTLWMKAARLQIASWKAYNILAKANPSALEKAAGEELSKVLGEPVFALPELRPYGTASNPTVLPGVKYPDVLVGSELAEIYSPKTASMGELVKELGTKMEQAPNLVVSLLDPAQQLGVEQVALAAAKRVWTSPRGSIVSRIIVLGKGGTNRILTRPALFNPLGLPVAPFTAGWKIADMEAAIDDAPVEQDLK